MDLVGAHGVSRIRCIRECCIHADNKERWTAAMQYLAGIVLKAFGWRLVDRAMGCLSMDLFDPRFHAQDGRFALVSANRSSNL